MNYNTTVAVGSLPSIPETCPICGAAQTGDAVGHAAEYYCGAIYERQPLQSTAETDFYALTDYDCDED
tara:strand:- start:25951 stop:26154 length:204 start_codon:yes stop_codon:yes gene_type:complete